MPTLSVARTANVWLPSARAGERVSGLVQEAQLPLSRRHSKVEPGSLELKLNVGVAFPEGSVGLESIVVFGAVLSTRRFVTTLVPSLSALSVATARRS